MHVIFSEQREFRRYVDHVFQDLRLSRAIRDLIDSISGPHLIPANCARAIETLRTVIVPKGIDRKRGWPMMQEHLRLSA
jgi:hypothetical protein